MRMFRLSDANYKDVVKKPKPQASRSFLALQSVMPYPYLSKQQIDDEKVNILKRISSGMTNAKYLERRDFKFFNGTLRHLNEFENLEMHKVQSKMLGKRSIGKFDEESGGGDEDDVVLLPMAKRRNI